MLLLYALGALSFLQSVAGRPAALEAQVPPLLVIHQVPSVARTRVSAGTAIWDAAAGEQQSWIVSEHESHRSWAARPAPPPIPGSRIVVATLRGDLSYRPEALIGARAVSIAMVRTHAGRTADYVAERRIVKAAHEKAATDEHYSVYQVTAGLPAGTFFVVIPYADLGDLDEVNAIHGAAYDAALGDEGRTRTRELVLTGVAQSETRLFRARR